MKKYPFLLILLLTIISSCTSLDDQRKFYNRLYGKDADFNSFEEAHRDLDCTDFEEKERTLLFGPKDKVIKLSHSQSYIKKICLKDTMNKIVVRGKHVGGGRSKAFYAVPAIIAFSEQDKPIKSHINVEENRWTGNLEFTLKSDTKFESLLVLLNTENIEESFGGNEMATYYKYPEGEVEIISK